MPYYRVPLNVIMFAAGGLLGLLVWLWLLGLQVLRHKKYVEEVMEHHKKYVEEVNKKVWLIVLGCSLALICWIVCRLFKMRRKREENRRRNDAARERSLRLVDRIREGRDPRPNLDGIPEALRCIVCLGAEREVILLDCGHVCACADCAANLLRMNQGCPVCRSPLGRVALAYMS